MDIRIDALRLDGDRLIIAGQAFRVGAGGQSVGSVGLVLLRRGRPRRFGFLTRLSTQLARRRAAAMQPTQQQAGSSTMGFTATLDLRSLRRGRRWRHGTWTLYASVTTSGSHRTRKLLLLDDLPQPAGVQQRTADATALVRATPTQQGELVVEIATRWAAIHSQRLQHEALELSGEVRGFSPAGLELRGAAGTPERQYRVEVAGRPSRTFTTQVPLADVARMFELPTGAVDLAGHEREIDPSCDLFLFDAKHRVRLALDAQSAEAPFGTFVDARQMTLSRTPRGDASLVVQTPRAVLTGAEWDGDGTLTLAGERLPHDPPELVLFSPDRLVQHAFPAGAEAGGRFSSVARPAAIDSLAGPLPLPHGRWRLCGRRAGDANPAALASMTAAPSLAARLPLSAVVAHKRFALTLEAGGDVLLAVSRDLDDDERGAHNQRALRRSAYSSRRTEPLLDTVVYTSFRGRQYSDSPRAIHENLVSRGAPLRHLWVVRDGACPVPATAQLLREGSRDHYEALARTRYFVTNDHFPEWFERRPDQTCVQTWHGTPLKQLGFDVSRLRGTSRKFEQGWSRQLRNWQYVVSPNRFSTPILKRAYELEPEAMIETGYPRDDVLAAPGAEARTAQLRKRLGLPDGVRVVLYAPTYRDHVKDARGRYRLDLQLDLDRLREALGPDTVLLFRKHHYIVDDVPTTADGFVRDVSSFPDGTELLLAADVLVTDYSSMIVDFANTGRPILLFTYDVDAYRDEIRGFYIDFEATVPGPLLTTSDDVVEALQDLEGVRSQFTDRYQAFTAKFCELDDGGAAARVADRLFDL